MKETGVRWQNQDRRIAGSQDRRIAGSQDRRIAGSQDRRIAGSQDRRIAGSQDRSKRFSLLLLICLMTVAVASWGIYTKAAAESNVTEISTAEQLAAISNDLTGNYKLIADIDLQGSDANQWTPIGTVGPDYDLSDAFTGKFDGNGHTISGLYIRDGGLGKTYQGLFGALGEGGEVSDLAVSGDITDCYEYVGLIVGYSVGTVKDCTSTGTVSGSFYIGGVLGWNGNFTTSGDANTRISGTVTNCTSNVEVTGDSVLGGIVGFNDMGTVIDCTSSCNVDGAGSNIGGIVGSSGHGTVTNCTSTGVIEGYSKVGGIVGDSYRNTATVTNCTSSAEVSGTENIGGIVGLNERGSRVINCTSSAEVSGLSNCVGGVVGQNIQYAEVINCTSTSTSNVSSGGDNSEVGGIAGKNDEGGIVTNCISNSTVSGSGESSQVGGVVGWNNDGSTVTNCTSTGTVDGAFFVGGVVGFNNDSDITNCLSTGAVSSTGDSEDIGGIVGRNFSNVTNCGWLSGTATNGIGTGGEGTVMNILSFNETDKSKIAVSCTVAPTLLTVPVGGTGTVSFDLAPYAEADISRHVTSVDFTFSSSDIAPASFSQGVATVNGLSYGTTLMTVSYDMRPTRFSGDLTEVAEPVELTAKVMVTVSDFAITPPTAAITVGATTTLTAGGHAANENVRWTVAGDAVSLSGQTGTEVTATGLAAGTATVTATAEDGVTATATITVTETPSNRHSSGGCNTAGIPALALLAAIPALAMATRRRKR